MLVALVTNIRYAGGHQGEPDAWCPACRSRRKSKNIANASLKILAEVTNQSILCHKHIFLPRTSLIWMLQDEKMTNGEINALIQEIIWKFFFSLEKIEQVW